MNSPLRVLIAEDNLLNQKIIAVMMQRLGWSFCIVENGRKAVDECNLNDYDVVLMDIDMPVMNGWDATIEIKRNSPQIPVIALTAYSEETFREKSYSVGMDYFLAKPYNHEEIRKTVLKSLETER
ncbi:MAG: response regulator [Omnitrophica WOR_2 bacterium]|jgi:CheY-like chemotaxis protein